MSSSRSSEWCSSSSSASLSRTRLPHMRLRPCSSGRSWNRYGIPGYGPGAEGQRGREGERGDRGVMEKGGRV